MFVKGKFTRASVPTDITIHLTRAEADDLRVALPANTRTAVVNDLKEKLWKATSARTDTETVEF